MINQEAGHRLNLNGRHVYYYELNQGKDEVVLMVHGHRGNHRGLLRLASHFAEYRVIIPDLPGFGQSEAFDQHSLEGYAEFLAEFIQALKLSQFSLVGHSFGAAACVLFASHSPEGLKKLVLITPTTASKRLLARVAIAYYHTVAAMPRSWRRHILGSRWINRIESHLLLKTAGGAFKQTIMRERLRDLGELQDEVAIGSFFSVYQTPVFRAAPKIKMPTLLIGGGADRIAPVESLKKLKRLIEGAQLVMMPSAGHLVPLEEPARMAELCLRFLEPHAKLKP
jgi:pimeloyl-ACP methyl ester carboxylesterase